MSGKSPRPDFGWTDYRFKINDDFGMLHETTLGKLAGKVDFFTGFLYNTMIVMREKAVGCRGNFSNFWYVCGGCVIFISEGILVRLIAAVSSGGLLWKILRWIFRKVL